MKNYLLLSALLSLILAGYSLNGQTGQMLQLGYYGGPQGENPPPIGGTMLPKAAPCCSTAPGQQQGGFPGSCGYGYSGQGTYQVGQSNQYPLGSDNPERQS